MTREDQINHPESEKYDSRKEAIRKFPRWLKVSAVAAGSLLAGGLAAAWIYRKSIATLQNPEETPGNSNFGIPAGEIDDEI